MTTYVSVELRRLVIERAGNCCEYCLTSQQDVFFSFEIDHIIAEKHGGTTTADNLCWSCPDCNVFKGSDIASIDAVTKILTALYNPRTQNWRDHFELQGALIVPLTAVGRVSVFILQLNGVDRVIDRQLLLSMQRYPCLNFSGDQ